MASPSMGIIMTWHMYCQSTSHNQIYVRESSMRYLNPRSSMVRASLRLKLQLRKLFSETAWENMRINISKPSNCIFTVTSLSVVRHTYLVGTYWPSRSRLFMLSRFTFILCCLDLKKGIIIYHVCSTQIAGTVIKWYSVLDKRDIPVRLTVVLWT